MLQHGTEAQNVLNDLSKAEQILEVAPWKIDARRARDAQCTVTSVDEAYENLKIYQVHEQRHVEARGLEGIAFVTKAIGGGEEAVTGNGEPTLTSSGSVCSYTHVSRIATGQSNVTEAPVLYPWENRVEEEEIKASCWFWPWRWKRATEKQPADQSQQVKKKPPWSWEPKSKKRGGPGLLLYLKVSCRRPTIRPKFVLGCEFWYSRRPETVCFLTQM